jgi:hypothetical protein
MRTKKSGRSTTISFTRSGPPRLPSTPSNFAPLPSMPATRPSTSCAPPGVATIQ